MSCQSAGTPTIAVTLPSDSACASRSPVKPSRYDTRAPRESGRMSPQVNSNVWWRGSTESTRSPGRSGKSGASCAASEVKFAWVSLTPFGVPVVPLVNSTDAMSDGPTTTGVAAGAPSAAVRAWRSKTARVPAAPACLAEASASQTTARARLSSRMRASPSASIAGSTGTTAAPARCTPNALIPQSGWLCAMTTTASPGWIPAAWRRPAAAIERSFTSANVTRLNPSASRWPSATASPCRSAIASTRCTSVGCERRGFVSRRTFLSISGITRFSKAGSCTFIIQSA